MSLPENKSYSSPILIPGIWESSSMGMIVNGGTWVALKKDGRMWGCGSQSESQSVMGRYNKSVPNSDAPKVSSPIQLNAGFWKAGSVQGGHYGGMGIKRNCANEDYTKGIDQINV